MSGFRLTERARFRLLMALNLALRLGIIYWLAEAWVMREDPRFAGKAIPERNTIIVIALSLLFPTIWYFRRRPWSKYPLGLDIVYLGIYGLDMAGNSLNLYSTYRYFDLVPHFHSTGAFSLVVAVYWARRTGLDATVDGKRLLETTLVAAGIATIVHVGLEAQEYYTDRFAGTINVRDVADVVNDMTVGLVASLLYPPLALRWFLPGVGRVGLLSAFVALMLVASARW